MKPDYQSYTKDELLDVMQNIDREAWPERYSEIKKQLQKFEHQAEDNNLNETPKKSYWREIDFNKFSEKAITLFFMLWLFYILFTGEIIAKHSYIEFDSSPKTFGFIVALFAVILIWRIHGHFSSYTKRTN